MKALDLAERHGLSTVNRVLEETTTSADRARIRAAWDRRDVSIGRDAINATINTGDRIFQIATGAAAERYFALEAEAKRVPAQIPRPVADFVGRVDEIRTIAKLLDASTPGATTAVISGMGGSGKSELAFKVAHDLANGNRFPDGMLRVDMLGIRESPLTARAAMEIVIRAYYPKARLPDDDSAVAETYREVLNGKQALLLLDDARDEAQVRPLAVPTSAVPVIVTSRRRIVLDGSLEINCGRLSSLDAVALVRDIAGAARASETDLSAIADACGHLPLALRVAGRFLKLKPSWTAAMYLEKLADVRTRLPHLRDPVDSSRDVAVVLRVSAEQLHIDANETFDFWRMLAIFPSSFDVEAAKSVWDLEDERARGMIDELFNRSLVLADVQAETGEAARFRLHDLMRDVSLGFGEQDLDEAAFFGPALDRYAVHYAQVLDEARLMIGNGRDGVLAAYARYDRERENIEEAWSWLSETWCDDEFFTNLCVKFWVLSTHFTSRLSPQERIDWALIAFDASRASGIKEAEGLALMAIGNAKSGLLPLGQTTEDLQKAIEIFREINSKSGEATALICLADKCSALQYFDNAINYLLCANNIAENIEDYELGCLSMVRMGSILVQIAPREAEKTLSKALDLARDMGLVGLECETLLNLAFCHAKRGQYRQCMQDSKGAIKLARQFGFQELECLSLYALADGYLKCGEAQAALKHFDQALILSRQSNNRLIEMVALLGASSSLLICARKRIGFLEKASQYAEQCQQIAVQLQDYNTVALTKISIASVLWCLGNYDGALRNLREARDILSPAASFDNGQAFIGLINVKVMIFSLRLKYFFGLRSHPVPDEEVLGKEKVPWIMRLLFSLYRRL